MSLVQVSHLTKTYGRLTAVADFAFEAEAGQILALVGPDGAGKTTLFRAVCGLLVCDAGQINIADFNALTEFARIKPLLGYMPQTFSLYPDLSVEENLRFYAGLFGLKKHEYAERSQRLYQFSALGPFQKRRAADLSGGMKQKLALSCNLIHNPRVLVLDEPTTGVDPLSRRQFWDILRQLRAEGAAIVVSTPYMDEVALADRAIFMLGGRKLAEGTPQELVRIYRGRVFRLEVEPTAARMRQLSEIKGIEARRFGAAVHIALPDNGDIEALARKLDSLGIAHSHLAEISPGLEDVFIQLMVRREDSPQRGAVLGKEDG